VKYIISGMESEWSGDNIKQNMNNAFCGDYSTKQTLSLAYDQYISSNSSTTHMTIIFNIFVFYTLFNQINCRIIDDSYNILQRINQSIFFIIIIIIEIGLQIIIIFFGSSAFHIVDQGLTGTQWGISLGFSAITFFVSVIGKSIPLDRFFDKFLSPEKKIQDIDPVAPKLTDLNDIIIGVENKDILKEEEDEEEIISEKISLNMMKYDFNNVNKDKKDYNIEQISSRSNLIKEKETDIEKENINHNSENEAKKYDRRNK